jgi:hypothetical protein
MSWKNLVVSYIGMALDMTFTSTQQLDKSLRKGTRIDCN